MERSELELSCSSCMQEHLGSWNFKVHSIERSLAKAKRSCFCAIIANRRALCTDCPAASPTHPFRLRVWYECPTGMLRYLLEAIIRDGLLRSFALQILLAAKFHWTINDIEFHWIITRLSRAALLRSKILSFSVLLLFPIMHCPFGHC